MKLVILAGGLGTRITEETKKIPKPMVLIGRRPIVWHIIKYYSYYGINKFIICCGYKGKIIKDYFDIKNSKKSYFKELIHKNPKIRIDCIDTGLDTMTGGRIKKIYKYIKNDPFFFLTYGDGLSDVNIKKQLIFFKKHQKLALVTAVRQPSRFGLMKIKGNLVEQFKEKPIGSTTERINGGFFILRPEIIKYIKDYETIWEKFPLKHLAKNDELLAYKHDKFWQPMDTLRDKIFLNKVWNSNNCPWKK